MDTRTAEKLTRMINEYDATTSVGRRVLADDIEHLTGEEWVRIINDRAIRRVSLEITNERIDIINTARVHVGARPYSAEISVGWHPAL